MTPGRGGGGPGGGNPDRVGDLLDGLFRKLGLDEEVARQEALTAWEGVVGPKIADVTRAVAVSNGVLFVRVSSSAWLNELNLMRHDIIARLNGRGAAGRVERIVFSLDQPREG